MDNEQDNSKTENRPAGIGPGERLQAARIQQGLSIDDVASRMHLSPGVLKSIENNSFEEITAPIFVKGYLRAYSRIVSLDEDELIQQYADYYSNEDPPISTTSHMAPELSVADVRIKWTTYLVILGLAALLAAWWWNKKQGDVMPISLDSQSGQQEILQPEAGSTGEAAEPGADSLAESGAPEPPALEPVPAEPQPVPAPEPEPAAVSEPVPMAVEPEFIAGDAAEAEARPVEPESASGSGDMAATETAVAAPEPAVAAPEPAPRPTNTPVMVAPSGSDRLSITVNADTWADIKDSTDYQMVYDLLRAGQSLELTGSAPFSVFLGNGHGVEIRFNNEEIDFSRRIRNDNTTRLTVGG